MKHIRIWIHVTSVIALFSQRCLFCRSGVGATSNSDYVCDAVCQNAAGSSDRFSEFIRAGGVTSVLDSNSIEVRNTATDKGIPYAISDGERLEFVVADPGQRNKELRLRRGAYRFRQQPQKWVPQIGIGNLLRNSTGNDEKATEVNTEADRTTQTLNYKSKRQP